MPKQLRGNAHSLPLLRPLSRSRGARGRRAVWPGGERALALHTHDEEAASLYAGRVHCGRRGPGGGAKPPTAGGLVLCGHLPARGLRWLISATLRNRVRGSATARRDPPTRGDKLETPKVRTPPDSHGPATCPGPAEASGLPAWDGCTDVSHLLRSRHECPRSGTRWSRLPIQLSTLVLQPTSHAGHRGGLEHGQAGGQGTRVSGCGPLVPSLCA